MKFRLANPADGGAIASIYAPIVQDTTISFEYFVPDADEMARRVVSNLKAHPWIVCEIDGTVIGYAYASPHRTRAAYQWACEVSAYVADSFRGQGIASLLYSKLFDILRRQGYCLAYAGITYPNEPSVAFHKSMGFEPIGIYKNIGFKMGAWRDVGWWGLSLCDQNEPPL